MKKSKELSFLSYLKIYYSYAGNNILILLVTISLSGILEAVGISMFVPILDLTTKSNNTKLAKTTEYVLHLFNLEYNLQNLLILLVSIFILKAVVIFLNTAIALYIQYKLKKTVMVKLVKSISTVQYKHFVKKNSGHFTNVLIREVPRFLQGFMELTRIPVSAAYVIVYFSIAFSLEPKYTVYVFTAGASLYILMNLLTKIIKRYSIEATKRASILQSFFIEYIQNFIYFKSTFSSPKAIQKLKEKIDNFNIPDLKQGILSSLLSAITEPFGVCILAFLIYTIVSSNGRSISEVLVLAFVLNRVVNQILLIQGQWQRFNGVIGGINIVNKELVELNNNREKKGDINLSHNMKNIEFRNLSLSYDSKNILNNINLKINSYELIAIVGPSGSGKTTLVNLMTSLSEPDKGQILFNGIDYRNIDPDTLRKRIGYVTQDPVVMNDTIVNNITLWENQEDVSHSKLNEIIKLANCQDFIKDVDSSLGERGNNLSGGQKQRIAISRELFRNPEIIFFDEATSALDTESETKIIDSLKKLKGTRTIILVAHRLSTVKHADKIIVLEKGKIEETGTFEELLLKNGIFTKMCNGQGIYT